MSETVKPIAFYLPQYHPIPENDGWWGEGFTEWTNVRASQPLFDGHRQPRVPHDDAGYYDLRDIGVQKKQAEMAKSFGIHGFCYYHYWFGGKKLLETPLQNLLRHPEVDFPFCVCWANENWTRRWDGQDNKVLIRQNHGDADDLAFITDLIPAFSDPRYIKVNGRPLLVIYRTELFPDIRKTAKIWRDAMRAAEMPDPYLVRVEGFAKSSDPKNIGFDAAIEFAPDWQNIAEYSDDFLNAASERDSESENPDTSDANMKNTPRKLDYEVTIAKMLAKRTPQYKLFRGVFPDWDNTPRRGVNGTLFANVSEEAFGYFLERQIANTIKAFSGDERLLFINAWNEWGEGCALEPDAEKAYRLLEICREKLGNAPTSGVLQRQIRALENIIRERSGDADKYEELSREMKFMKSSKFWRFREAYMRCKNKMRCLWKK
jgi:hypothetical protein